MRRRTVALSAGAVLAFSGATVAGIHGAGAATGAPLEVSARPLVMYPTVADPDVRTGTLALRVTAPEGASTDLTPLRFFIHGLAPSLDMVSPSAENCAAEGFSHFCDRPPPPPGQTGTYRFYFSTDDDEFTMSPGYPQGPSVEVFYAGPPGATAPGPDSTTITVEVR